MPDRGFAPLVCDGARVLVLGSLPGKKSLAEREYYAHPQNAFWKIMGALFNAGPELPYAHRTQRLTRAGVAVWDVLASSVRPGSLDASIRAETASCNDFPAFFRRYPDITTLCFNGKKAAHLFATLVATSGLRQNSPADRLLLPSTSPAYAGMPFAEKLRHWSVVRKMVNGSI
jgi:hypoxanthine-DNA glycosylase